MKSAFSFRIIIYSMILLAAVIGTYILKAQAKQIEKQYTVSLPLQKWIQLTQQLDFIKEQLRQSDRPSREVAYIADSIITPMQNIFSVQVNQQWDFENRKKDTITNKFR